MTRRSSLVIDAHQHFWDISSGRYPWMDGDEMAPLRRNFGAADLRPLMRRAGVGATILVQCRHDREETLELLAIAEQCEFVCGVVGWVDLQREDVADQIEALRDLPGGRLLVGIRHNVHDEPDAAWLSRPAVHRGVAAVVEAGLAFDLLVRTRELPAAADLAGRFPAGRFVLDHMAKPPISAGFQPEWKIAFEDIASRGNVWCKISGLVTEAGRAGIGADVFDPYLAIARDVFGGGRLIFGSDWPVCTLSADYSGVRRIADRITDAAPEIREPFHHRNATDAYRLRAGVHLERTDKA